MSTNTVTTEFYKNLFVQLAQVLKIQNFSSFTVKNLGIEMREFLIGMDNLGFLERLIFELEF